MKNLFCVLILLVTFVSQAFANPEIKYNESLLPYKGGILISNMGSLLSTDKKAIFFITRTESRIYLYQREF